MHLTINQLPNGEYKEVLQDAYDRGKEILGEHGLDITQIFILGLADIIKDMKKGETHD